MLGLGGAEPNTGEDAGGGVEVGDASYMLMAMAFWSIKSWIALRKVKQLSVECPTARW